MGVIEVLLLPPDLGDETYVGLLDRLHEAVTAIDELGLTKRQISVAFVPDLCPVGLGAELVVRMFGFDHKAEPQTEAIKEKLRQVVGHVVGDFAREHIPQCERIDVYLLPYRQAVDGFLTIALL